MNEQISVADVLGKWALPALLNMLGVSASPSADPWFDHCRGVRGKFVIAWGEEIGSIEPMAIDERDPVALLDAFRCAACGMPHRGAPYRVHSAHWWRRGFTNTRTLCSLCGTLPEPQSSKAIALRGLAISLPGMAWEFGQHGLAGVGEIRGTLVHPNNRAARSGALVRG